MDISCYMTHDRLGNANGLKSTFRQGLGSLIWIHQTRPDVGFLITKLATDMIRSCADLTKAKQWRNLYSKTVRFIRRHQIKIHYKHDPKSHETHQFSKLLTDYRIISFADAGFASLEGDHIIESNVVILAGFCFEMERFDVTDILRIVGVRKSNVCAGRRYRRNVMRRLRPVILPYGIKYCLLKYSLIPMKSVVYALQPIAQ